MSLKKRKDNNFESDAYNSYLMEVYGKPFKLVSAGEKTAIFTTPDNIMFRVFDFYSGMTDNLHKSVCGYKLNQYIKSKIPTNDDVCINTRINCLDEIYFGTEETAEDLIKLANQKKFLTTVLVGICKTDNMDEVLNDIENRLKSLNIKNCELEVLVVEKYYKKTIKSFVDEYNMSDGDLGEYRKDVIKTIRKKIN